MNRARVERDFHQPQELPRRVPRSCVSVEKNLASLGFFTPSSKRIRRSKKKTIVFNKEVEGKKIEVRAIILPSAEYGLPTTADQDKYLAFQQIVTEIRHEMSEVRNPIGFTSVQILRILGLNTKAGKNYEEVAEWARRMTLTGICSEGVVYLAGRRIWASDTFHVFERFVSVGKQLPDGTLADRNYVWLSEWQLENINQNHQFPIDLSTYKQLKNHIAKALVPLLQIWLFASREGGCFEKRYQDLCQILNIQEYRHLSRIEEKLRPSLDELRAREYLSDWKIQQTSDGKSFKIILHHGQRFRCGVRRRIDEDAHLEIWKSEHLRTQKCGDLLQEMTRRGIGRRSARALLRNLVEGQQVLDQLEWGDHLLSRAPGFYVHLIKENVIPPERFESSRKRRLRELVRQNREVEEQGLARLELAYLDYKRRVLERHINQNFTAAEMANRVQAKKQELMSQDRWKRYFSLKPKNVDAAVERQVRAEIATGIHFMTFNQYREKRQGRPTLSKYDDPQAQIEPQLLAHGLPI